MIESEGGDSLAEHVFDKDGRFGGDMSIGEVFDSGGEVDRTELHELAPNFKVFNLSVIFDIAFNSNIEKRAYLRNNFRSSSFGFVTTLRFNVDSSVVASWKGILGGGDENGNDFSLLGLDSKFGAVEVKPGRSNVFASFIRSDLDRSALVILDNEVLNREFDGNGSVGLVGNFESLLGGVARVEFEINFRRGNDERNLSINFRGKR